MKLANELNIPLVIANDVHYIAPKTPPPRKC